MTPEARQLELPDGEVVFYPAFFSPSESDGLFQRLLSTTEWRQDVIQMYGKDVNLPRLTAWYGDAGTGYVYSGIENTPRPWTEVLTDVKAAIEPACGVTFNSVLLNRYRTGQDSVSWHSDDEPEFGENPVIGSVSFGGETPNALAMAMLLCPARTISIIVRCFSFSRRLMAQARAS